MICSHHCWRPLPPCCIFATLAPNSRAYRGVTSRAYPSSSNATTYTIRFSTLISLSGFPVAVGEGDGSNALRLLMIQRMGSTGSHRASALEKTSVQYTGGVVLGSGDRSSTTTSTYKRDHRRKRRYLEKVCPKGWTPISCLYFRGA